METRPLTEQEQREENAYAKGYANAQVDESKKRIVNFIRDEIDSLEEKIDDAALPHVFIELRKQYQLAIDKLGRK